VWERAAIPLPAMEVDLTPTILHDPFVTFARREDFRFSSAIRLLILFDWGVRAQ